MFVEFMKIKIENFEGPLDLLLQLVEKDELDITQVSLLAVSEQYISYLDAVEKKEPEMLADFLLIAAKLLYIKSKVLLPELELDTEEDSFDLANQLRMYKKYVEASKNIEDLFYRKEYAYSRPDNVKLASIEFVPAPSLDKAKLNKVMAGIIKGLDEIARLPKKSLARVISIKEKIKQIQKLLSEKDDFSFSELTAKVKNRTEAIVSFLGLLELAKQREIILKQDLAFGEIYIKKSVLR